MLLMLAWKLGNNPGVFFWRQIHFRKNDIFGQLFQNNDKNRKRVNELNQEREEKDKLIITGMNDFMIVMINIMTMIIKTMMMKI